MPETSEDEKPIWLILFMDFHWISYVLADEYGQIQDWESEEEICEGAATINTLFRTPSSQLWTLKFSTKYIKTTRKDLESQIKDYNLYKVSCKNVCDLGLGVHGIRLKDNDLYKEATNLPQKLMSMGVI